MHNSAYRYVADFLLELPPFARFRILEFGSRDVNGSVRDIFVGHSYYGIDLTAGPGVDEVADAATYTYSAGKADVVICCEVLEHTPSVQAIVENAYRNLNDGGWFVVTCATHPRLPHSAIDGGYIRRGEYYRNVRAEELKVFAIEAGFIIQDLRVRNLSGHGGDLYMTAHKPRSSDDTRQDASERVS